MTVNTAERLEFVKSLATEAGALAMHLRQEKSGDFIQNKGLQDFVTFADHEVEKLIRARIAEAYPDEALLGEEEGLSGGNTEAGLWVVDPIDGTTNFMHGLADWAVSIAWCVDGKTQLGVLAAPDLGILAWATLGQGAFVNGQPIHVSTCARVDQSILLLGRSDRKPLADYLAIINRTLTGGGEYRRNGAATICLLAVARGAAEGYYEAHLNAWDALAGLLLITEAGGRAEIPPLSEFLKSGGQVFADNTLITRHLRGFCEDASPHR